LSLVDADVHPHFRDGLNDLMPHLSSSWRRKLGFGPNQAWAKQLGVELALPQNVLYMNPSGIMRRDSIPQPGWSSKDPVAARSPAADPMPRSSS
jgi:hypothetical protein